MRSTRFQALNRVWDYLFDDWSTRLAKLGLERRAVASRKIPLGWKPSRFTLETLEDRITPDGRPLPLPFVFVGSASGAPPLVRAYHADTGELAYERTPFDAGFTGGVRVAAGDINHDGIPDLIAAAGPGGGPRVRIFDGITGDQIAGPLGSFFAYDSKFAGGVSVASGDVDGDSWADLITAAGAGGGPHIKVFSGKTGLLIDSFYAFDPAFRGGATIAAADFNGDGRAEVAVGAGAGAGPHVKIFDLQTNDVLAGPLGSFMAFDRGMKGGVEVGTDFLAGDVTGDGKADLVVGAGPGTGSRVQVYNGVTGALVADFSPFGAAMTAGVRVSTAYVDDDPRADIIVGTGAGPTATVKVFSGLDFSELAAPMSGYTPFGSAYTGGLFVAGSNDPPQDSCCSYKLPYDKTFNWTDAFGVDTINAARVRETVTVQSATVYRWRFEVSNTSGNGGLPDDLYDLGIGRFSLYALDTSAITPRTPPPGWTVAFYTNSDGSGTIVWQGGSDPIFVGESPVAFEFDTPPRALCDNGGYVFNANAEEQTAATGMVMMPGKDEATKKEGWTSWEEDTVAPAPGGEGRGKKFPATPSWTTAQAGERKTPGPPAANKDNIGEEGPYYKSKDKWGAFTLTIEFRFADEPTRVRPGVPMPNPLKNQDFNNSGVYIHNRYEIQIVNPHRFDAAGGGAVAEGADVGDDPQDKKTGAVIPGNRNKLIPGGLYAVDSPNGEFKNRSKAAPAWNTLIIEYCPPVLEADPARPGKQRIKTPAKLKTTLNGKEVWATADKEMADIKDGTGSLNGTGGKSGADPVDSGYIYLQSHWGNQVEFRSPVINGKLVN